MKLSFAADYSLRMLLYLAVSEGKATVAEIAQAYGISRHHLVKVAHNLVKLGYLETTRGRSGGVQLARTPESINLGEVVRTIEPSAPLVECFHPETNTCPIVPACALAGVLSRAEQAFFTVLDGHTLSDAITERDSLRRLLDVESLSAPGG